VFFTRPSFSVSNVEASLTTLLTKHAFIAQCNKPFCDVCACFGKTSYRNNIYRKPLTIVYSFSYSCWECGQIERFTKNFVDHKETCVLGGWGTKCASFGTLYFIFAKTGVARF